MKRLYGLIASFSSCLWNYTVVSARGSYLDRGSLDHHISRGYFERQSDKVAKAALWQGVLRRIGRIGIIGIIGE